MALTPWNLIYNELIGLEVEVTDSSNKCAIGIRGKVVDETRNMLVLETHTTFEKMIPKSGNTFVFHLPDPSNGNITYVEVNGDLLISQPENRTKNIIKSRMR
ncbi:ribonuclease P protein component 1 [Methanohalophilus sp.]|uniref:ribonuclease P protein component 1 n=1 Tax=Methanohalophilus sp. TaxID=1966352 RepID=UPI00262AEB12|nr:ribonuclease P protein component 1 [Methanohalophilus sp.]MDK2892411.1 ribonuclease protein subunit [Methanohalophilus sp.]